MRGRHHGLRLIYQMSGCRLSAAAPVQAKTCQPVVPVRVAITNLSIHIACCLNSIGANPCSFGFMVQQSCQRVSVERQVQGSSNRRYVFGATRSWQLAHAIQTIVSVDGSRVRPAGVSLCYPSDPFMKPAVVDVVRTERTCALFDPITRSLRLI